MWYTAQHQGALGYLDPQGNNGRGKTRHIPLGKNSAPHGVIVGPDGAPWVTDSGLNAIVRVDPKTDKVKVFPLPKGTPNTNLNTATFDNAGILWFTGQVGYYGRLDPKTGKAEVFKAPRGRGPCGICTAPPATTKAISGYPFHSISWTGYERLRRQHARLSLPPPEAIARLYQMLAEAA